MTQHEVARTLVKSAPELWEVCSDPDSLSRHLEPFGQIRITRVEPETTVAWEGERASGTVRIEPSGWGTRVILTATPVTVAEPELEVVAPAEVTAPEAPPVVVPEPAPAEPPAADGAEEDRAPAATQVPEADPDPGPVRPGFFRRLGGVLFRSLVTPVDVPEAAFPASPPAEPEAAPLAPEAGPSEPEPAAIPSQPEPEPAPAPVEPDRVAQMDTGDVLQAMLSRLGSDHHRPFSRS